MGSNIRAYVSRYVVPFYYDYEKNGFEAIQSYFLKSNEKHDSSLLLPKNGKWKKVGFWENYRDENNKQSETDLYSYLQAIFKEKETDVENVENLGVSFVYTTRNRKILELEYRKKDDVIPLKMTELGVLLLRNGIGFVWYEVESSVFQKKNNNHFLNNEENLSNDIKQYIEIQHDFKELARTNEETFVRKIGYDNENKKTLFDEVFCLGVWIADILSAEELTIRFWAERTTKRENKIVRIPDKALLFQYMFIEPASDEMRNDLIFRITNGYDEKYNVPENFDDYLYTPFGNTYFYVSKAGMSCVVEKDNTNEQFFDTQFKDKMKNDYFLIYLLLLYQSYSCAHYSRLLTNLPADESTFNCQNSYIDKIESLSVQINLFLVKSIFESVSNIHHQNGVYRYGKKELCIEGDIQSLTVGLEALRSITKERKDRDELEKEKAKQKEQERKDRKINLALTIFGFLIVISALLDGLNLVSWFTDNKINKSWIHWVIIIGIGILFVWMLIVLLKNLRNKSD